jgi:hypothetical protein
LFEIGFEVRQLLRYALPMLGCEQVGTPVKIPAEFTCKTGGLRSMGLRAGTIQVIMEKGGAYLLGVHRRALL